LTVRYRIDGILHDAMVLDKNGRFWHYGAHKSFVQFETGRKKIAAGRQI